MGYQVEMRKDDQSPWEPVGKVWPTLERAEQFFGVLNVYWVQSVDERELDTKEDEFHKNTRIVSVWEQKT